MDGLMNGEGGNLHIIQPRQALSLSKKSDGNKKAQGLLDFHLMLTSAIQYLSLCWHEQLLRLMPLYTFFFWTGPLVMTSEHFALLMNR